MFLLSLKVVELGLFQNPLRSKISDNKSCCELRGTCHGGGVRLNDYSPLPNLSAKTFTLLRNLSFPDLWNFS